MPPDRAPLPLRHAIALGLLQGPTELLPVSSSAHTSLIPWLCGWSYDTLDGERRKGFEIVLHAAGGLAIATEMRGELRRSMRAAAGAHRAGLALSLLPPALAGLLLRGAIERRLGAPRSIAAALLAGGAAMALADRRASGASRRAEDAGSLDGLALGVAQALALIPGVSRNGATLAAARARGFTRRDAALLSWQAALPVVVGASALEALRVARQGVPAEARGALAAGAGAAFGSTLLSARLTRGIRTRGAALLPFAAYRCLLAGVVVSRLRSAHNRGG
ncbi:MAG TPA: undecaprenyl-diphosphate phosphatase [Solirubrobacteraceae bacterium]|jgi:undecaprenyl-diphosphatase|nr:undecaprenyl-diphosphate phosphatase [Solirubrobacteraceae bacterium]